MTGTITWWNCIMGRCRWKLPKFFVFNLRCCMNIRKDFTLSIQKNAVHHALSPSIKKHFKFSYICWYITSIFSLVISDFFFFSCLHIAIERPIESAVLLSLTGVRSIIANQWYTTLRENAERLEILSESKYLYLAPFAGMLFRTFVCMHSWRVCIYSSPISPLPLLLTKFCLEFL